MFRSRFKRCYCMNNSAYNTNNNLIEDKCDDVCPCEYEECDQDNCECGFDEEDNLFPENPMFGQSYVPWQTMNKTFTPRVGLRMGTIFPELVSPYSPCQSIEEIEFIEATNKIGEGCNR